jgi:hypothetical protein
MFTMRELGLRAAAPELDPDEGDDTTAALRAQIHARRAELDAKKRERELRAMEDRLRQTILRNLPPPPPPPEPIPWGKILLGTFAAAAIGTWWMKRRAG